MNNKELRVKALSKIKHDNFSGLSAAAYVIAGLPLLAGDLTGNKLADIAITFAAAFIAALFCAAGYVRVAMGRWRFTKGSFRDLACCFTERNTTAIILNKYSVIFFNTNITFSAMSV